MKTFSTRAELSSGDDRIIETLPFLYFQTALTMRENCFLSERLSTILK